ncbi:MAG: PadR family transcriptional regulator [Anaerolineaceae bacterium]|nr:PadR family transcriptional regulator [Anaerolineaceae bacterium]
MNEISSVDKKFQKELNAGLTALILLQVMRQSEEPMYGYQIAKTIVEEKENSMQIKQGVLYPVLRSLEGNGLLESSVEPSISGPPRRYYHITPNGEETLIRWVNLWQQTRNFVDEVLGGTKSDA